MLIVKNISKNFGSFQALDRVSFEMNKGDIVGLLGKNGAGKTTLMRTLTSFITPSSGTVNIDGEDISKHSLSIRQKIGYLPEKPPLYGDMTVQYYLNFAAEIKGVPKNKRLFQLAKVLEECDLEQVKQKTIATLSKGYKQRVGIARALVSDPEVLLMDEPFAALDAQTRDIMQSELLRIWQEAKKTVLFVTHQIEEAVYLSDRVIVMTKRPGRSKKIIDIPLARPRDYEMRVTPEFNNLKLSIWNELKDEIDSLGGAVLD